MYLFLYLLIILVYVYIYIYVYSIIYTSIYIFLYRVIQHGLHPNSGVQHGCTVGITTSGFKPVGAMGTYAMNIHKPWHTQFHAPTMGPCNNGRDL